MESREEAIQKEVDAEIFPVPILVKRLRDVNEQAHYYNNNPCVDPDQRLDDITSTIIEISDALIQYFQKQIP